MSYGTLLFLHVLSAFVLVTSVGMFVAIALAILAATFACGCQAEPAPRTAPPVQAEMNRNAAIHAARSDAVARFGDGWIAWTSAHQLGRYWVVELRAHDGKGLRYAISTNDGSIRQRSVFQ